VLLSTVAFRPPATASCRQQIAGMLVAVDELPYWLEKGRAILLHPFRPFLRLGLNGIKKSLGRCALAASGSTGSSHGI
jgi:hypothetical protein